MKELTLDNLKLALKKNSKVKIQSKGKVKNDPVVKEIQNQADNEGLIAIGVGHDKFGWYANIACSAIVLREEHFCYFEISLPLTMRDVYDEHSKGMVTLKIIKNSPLIPKSLLDLDEIIVKSIEKEMIGNYNPILVITIHGSDAEITENIIDLFEIVREMEVEVISAAEVLFLADYYGWKRIKWKYTGAESFGADKVGKIGEFTSITNEYVDTGYNSRISDSNQKHYGFRKFKDMVVIIPDNKNPIIEGGFTAQPMESGQVSPPECILVENDADSCDTWSEPKNTTFNDFLVALNKAVAAKALNWVEIRPSEEHVEYTDAIHHKSRIVTNPMSDLDKEISILKDLCFKEFYLKSVDEMELLEKDDTITLQNGNKFIVRSKAWSTESGDLAVNLVSVDCGQITYTATFEILKSSVVTKTGGF